MAAFPVRHLAQLVELDSAQFYAQPSPVTINPDVRRVLSGATSAHSSVLAPVSVFILPEHGKTKAFTSEVLSNMIRHWLQFDDVFDRSFLTHILLAGQSAAPRFDGSTNAAVKEWNISVIETVQLSSPTPPGPYFLQGASLSRAYRIFPDTVGAFMFPTVPALDDPTTFLIPPVQGVPVPSRLYYGPSSDELPLSGVRLVVKDNIHLKGVKTSAGNKAFQELYPAASASASAVERLRRAGAVIIGKAKTVQFASGENARDWIDFQAPFNVRADGYQDPGCSSAGNSAAISAYDWADLSLATDTFGSVLGPAADHGIFGLRFSNEAVLKTGVVPMSQRLDSLGVMSRNIDAVREATLVLTGATFTSPGCPAVSELLYPVDLMEPSSPQLQSLIDRFITKLEAFIGHSKRTINLDAMFVNQSVGLGLSMNDYMKDTVAHIQLYDCYRNFEPFLQQYQAEFGKIPMADPFIRFKWALGKEITKQQYDEASTRYQTFNTWFERDVLPVTTQPNSPSRLDRLLVMPSGRVTPKYRHQYDGRTLEQGARMKQGFGFKGQNIVIVGEAPMVIIPIGQIPYHSEVTGREEWLPASVGLAGPKNSDAELLNFVSAFLHYSSDLRATVATGSVPYPHKSEPGKL